MECKNSFRGRLIDIFREKARIVGLIRDNKSNEVIRVVLDKDTPNLQVGMIVKVNGLVMQTCNNTTIEADNITSLTTTLCETGKTGLGEKRRYSTQKENQFFHLKLCNDGEAREYLQLQSDILAKLRNVLRDYDFIEIPCPMLTKNYHGGTSFPFTTYMNALKKEVFLRSNNTLPLEMCIAGGMERVYDMGSFFRNGSIDNAHGVPFNALEMYWAYSDYEKIRLFAKEIAGELIDTSKKYGRVKVPSWQEDVTYFDLMQRQGILPSVSATEHYHDVSQQYANLKENILPRTTGIFRLDYLPAGISPKIAVNQNNPSTLLRGHVVYNGHPVIEYYEAERNPEQFLESIKKQEAELSLRGTKVKRDYSALKHMMELGMPPYTSLFMSVDRFVTFLLGKDNVNEYHINI